MGEKSVRILLVEDSLTQARVIESMLKKTKIAQFDITFAETLKAAVASLASPVKFDVILLDLELPDSGGLDTVKNVHAKAPLLPIVVLSNMEGEHIEIEAVKLGAQDYLQKKHLDGVLLSRRIRFAVERQRMLKQIDENRRHELEELKKAVTNQTSLTGWDKTAVTAQMAGVGPLREREPRLFTKVLTDYKSLLDTYLEALGFRETPPRQKINALADRIGDHGGGPQDVVDIHLRAVVEKSSNVHPKRARLYTVEGRLLALEVMGNLVDYYRYASNGGSGNMSDSVK